VKLPSLIMPKRSEVEAAVQRVFKDAVVIDSSTSPSFVTGDFNGDSSEDIAVVLRPAAGKTGEINQSYPPWLLRDPAATTRGAPPTITVEERDVLLAIIHGFGENDWRDEQATQTFLLKNVAGSNMTVQTVKEFSTSQSGRQLPRPAGDLISENLHGANGFLYFASANYAWYDPKTFKPAPVPGVMHRH
jgi:hypothetical protein